jgi:hypothetical protein
MVSNQHEGLVCRASPFQKNYICASGSASSIASIRIEGRVLTLKTKTDDVLHSKGYEWVQCKHTSKRLGLWQTAISAK